MLGSTTACKIHICDGLNANKTKEDKSGDSQYAGTFSIFTYKHGKINMAKEQLLQLKTLALTSASHKVHSSTFLISSLTLPYTLPGSSSLYNHPM